MSWLGSLIGGVIGMAVGGPIGAAIGAGLGAVSAEGDEAKTKTAIPEVSEAERAYFVFFTGVFAMLGKIAGATG